MRKPRTSPRCAHTYAQFCCASHTHLSCACFACTGPFLSIVFFVAASQVVQATIDDARAQEAVQLAEAAARAIESLPSGNMARDDLRALRQKLVALLEVRREIQPEEWDATLSALLEADYYGVDDLTALLKPHLPGDGGAAGAECDADAREPTPGRKLGEQEQPPPTDGSQPHRPPPSPPPAPRPTPPSPSPPLPPGRPSHSAPHAELPPAGMPTPQWRARETGLAAEASALLSYSGVVLAYLSSWRSWALDRPPPWERDCDCCFAVCPPHHYCLAQSDGLVLACRGESVGEFLAGVWAGWPWCCAAATVVSLMGSCLWVRQQARVLRAAVYGTDGDGEEEKEEEEEDDDDEEEEEEEEDGDGGEAEAVVAR